MSTKKKIPQTEKALSKRAVILAGGKGTRLKPYTITLPKPLVPVGDDMPVLEIIIRQLKANGFNHITLAVNHMAEIIKAFFGDGTRWGVKIDYSEEVEPLGTMGPLQNIVDLPEHFLVMNGDVITDLNYSDFYNEHIEGGAIFTISSFEREEKIDYGVISSDGDFLRGLQEKPEVKYEVSMGIYMVSREVLSFIPTGVLFGFDQLMNKLLAIKRKISVRKHPKYWLDIGRPDDYQKALNDYNSKIKENIAQLRSGE